MRRAGLLDEAGMAEFSNGCERSEHGAFARCHKGIAREAERPEQDAQGRVQRRLRVQRAWSGWVALLTKAS
jgi:hypothetical protein